MNAYDFMDAMNGIAPEKVQRAIESMGYAGGRPRTAHPARRVIRTVLIAAALTVLLTACGYAACQLVNSPEQAFRVARQEISKMQDMGLLADELTFPDEPDRVTELPEREAADSEYWYGRIFRHSYNVSARGEKYRFDLDVDTATGKITYMTIEAEPDEDDVPYKISPAPDGASIPDGGKWGKNFVYFDNYDDIFPADITLDRFCTLLSEYWGFSGYTIAGMQDGAADDHGTEAPSGDTPLAGMAHGPYITVYFDGDQSGAPMYIELISYCYGNGVCITAGTGHAVG